MNVCANVSSWLRPVEPKSPFADVMVWDSSVIDPRDGRAHRNRQHFRDRKAAVFIYARRLHPISLLVFRVEGLAWPARELTRIGSVEAYTTAERGFNVIMWRTRELGYALVSDVDARDLRQLAARMAGGQ